LSYFEIKSIDFEAVPRDYFLSKEISPALLRNELNEFFVIIRAST
jgi:hypothetical protein